MPTTSKSSIIPGLAMQSNAIPKKGPLKLPQPQKPPIYPSDSRKKTTRSKPDNADRWERFVSESLTGKGLSSIPGLGATFSDAFTKYNEQRVTQQYIKVSQLLAQFLILECNERAFKSWLRHEVKIPTTQLINTCYNAIKEWWTHHNRRLP